MSDATRERPPLRGLQRSRRRIVGVAALVVVVGAAACAFAARPASDPDEGAPGGDGAIVLPEVPADVAMDAQGNGWATTRSQDGWTVWSLGFDGSVATADLDSNDADGAFGSSLVAFEDGVAVAHVVCSDEGCVDGDLAVDVVVLDDGELVVERRWTTSTGGIDAGPRVVAVGDGSLVVEAGSLHRLEESGEVEQVPFEANVGEPCLVDGRLLAVGSQVLPPEAYLDGEEHALLVVLDEGGDRLGVVGSEVSYDREAGYRTRCGSSGLEIARTGQPALQRWDDAALRWTDPAEPTALAWRFPVRDATPDGLVGVLDDAIVRVDSATGEVLASVPIPSELLDATPTALGGRVAIDAAGTRAVTCAGVGDGDPTSGDASSATCRVLEG